MYQLSTNFFDPDIQVNSFDLMFRKHESLDILK